MTDEHEGHDASNPGPAGQPGHDPVGSVAEEAVKLFGALSDWAKDHRDDLGHSVSGFAATAAAAAHEVNEHLATDAPECQWCPVCRAVHVVRELSPEVKTHLAVAGSSLLQAAAALLATAVPDQPARRHEDVEHIDLDGEWPE
ncbi:hypothetical protein ACLM5J_15055 [Nocardioides sp. Bht2]|uniref:hypothetical protein n=1 Tax=Nocardioides sp. Bht2 TaxID=3392297 RepID=UPI0039B6878A